MAPTHRDKAALSDWLVSLTMELGVKIGLLATASVVKLDGGAMFDASIHADVIRRSHSGSAMPPAFLDIVAAFA